MRIQSSVDDARRLLVQWQRRHGGNGAVYQGRPSTLLLTVDTTIEALEELIDACDGPGFEVEIIWRDAEFLVA